MNMQKQQTILTDAHLISVHVKQTHGTGEYYKTPHTYDA